jgi:hypothetical protein
MKMFLNKKIAMLLVFALIIPLIWNQNMSVALAATPTFVLTKVEIVGVGETYDLNIKDKVAKSTYAWSSSDTSIANVTNTGIITSVNKGTATIKCKITYPSKKTKTLSCKVTVTIPADEINITNAVEVNGAHALALGASFDFNSEFVPASSTDKVFWSVGGGDASCIRIDDASEGKITAIKAGKVILTATAAKTSTKDAADLSIVNDAIIIEIVGPTATVKSVDITGSNEIKAVFDSPVNQSTVIGLNNVLSDNIDVNISKDVKGVWADDPGKLTAVLSTDMKTLTITSQNALNGEYSISFSSSIMTTGGIAVEEYYKKISYTDILPPDLLPVIMDETGLIATIPFTEAMDFTNLKISGAKLISTPSDTASSTTISTLNNVLNYVISADKKSLTINLSSISAIDRGKLFSVIISGVKDLSGNLPATVYLTAYLRTDTTPKPQAKLLYIIRTGYKTLTATFDRAIQTPGWAQISGGSTLIGDVDTTDSKKVIYTMTDADAMLTGVQTVQAGFWDGYNVLDTDTSADKMQNYTVNFTYERTSPLLIDYKYDTETQIITLTYSEEVKLAIASGIFSSKFTSTGGEIRPNTNISYSAVAHTEGKHILKLKLTGMSLVGNYTFTMEPGFVSDNFNNLSTSRQLTIGTSDGNATELAPPYAIIQNPDNLSEITLEFLNMLDQASAETVSNYKISGLTILRAELKKNTLDSGATVVLYVANDSIVADVSWPVTITGVKGYNNSYTEIISYKTNVVLKENKRPSIVGSPIFDTTTKNTIKLNFDEAITGTLTVKVTQLGTNGGASMEYPNTTVTISGSIAYINLITVPAQNAWLRIDILTSDIKDLTGNAVVPMPSSLMVLTTY